MQVLSPDFSRYLCHSIKIQPDAQGQNDAHGTCAAKLPGICDVNLVSHTMGDGISPSAWSRGICKRENPTQGAPARAQCPTPAAKSAPSAAGGGGPKPLPTPMVLWVQSWSESHEGAGRAPPGSKKSRPKVTCSGHGLRLASSTSTRRQEAAAYRDVRRASTRVARASEQCKNGGRAATLSPKSRPKVHLPVLRARARPDSHGDLRTKASGASGCTGLTGALRGVEQGAAIGFSMGASVFSHRLPSLRTHAPSRSPGSLILGVGGGHPRWDGRWSPPLSTRLQYKQCPKFCQFVLGALP